MGLLSMNNYKNKATQKGGLQWENTLYINTHEFFAADKEKIKYGGNGKC